MLTDFELDQVLAEMIMKHKDSITDSLRHLYNEVKLARAILSI